MSNPESGARRYLSSAERRTLAVRSDRAGLFQIARHVALLVASGCWIGFRLPGWPVMLFVHGVLLVFLFPAMHECTHRTAFASRRANAFVASACGTVLLLSPTWFRCFHREHHRHTQDPTRDPELATPRPRTPWEYVVHVSGLPTWRSAVGTLWAHARGDERRRESFLSPASAHRVTREARAILVFHALVALVSLATMSSAVLTLWLVPILLGQPVLRLYLLAEHGHCPLIADTLVNTRTTITNGMVRALAWNMPYHAEHHAFPAVPFHRLPDLHTRLGARLHGQPRTTEQGYARFNGRFVRGLLR